MAGKMVPAGHAVPCGGINASISQMTPAESYMIVDVPLSSAASKRSTSRDPKHVLVGAPTLGPSLYCQRRRREVVLGS